MAQILYRNIVSTIFLAVISISILPGQNIETKRIQFEKGSSSMIIEAGIFGSEIVDYLLNLEAGQTLNVSMATDNAANYLNIMEPEEEYVAIFNGSVNENMFEGILEKSGDYRIRVYLMRSAARRNEKANYRLEIIASPLKQEFNPSDALVGTTSYHATGKISCRLGEAKPVENCDFGVIREGDGSGNVVITGLDGISRIIYFKNGQVTGFIGPGNEKVNFDSSKIDDIYVIEVGEERYEIPEAVIYGG